MSVVLVSMICACGHRGVLAKSADCPSCGGSHNDRVSPGRMRVLVALSSWRPGDPTVTIEPSMRIWLTRHGLIKRRSGRAEPSEHRRRGRPSAPTHLVTEMGERVVALDAPGVEITELARGAG